MHEKYLNEIKQQGYTCIPQVFNTESIDKLKQLVLREWEKCSQDQSIQRNVPKLNQGHKIIYNLQNKDIHFLKIFIQQPLLLSLFIHCLNDEWYKQIPKDSPNFIL